MREIKFRGKRTDNGEWVYGYYFQGFTGISYILVLHDHILGMTEFYEVDLETVGQYTGLKDKNGKEIYEGDICNCRKYECFGKVEWNNEEAGFYFCVVMEDGGFEEERLYEYADELAVIGNIHDNPKLLGGEDKEVRHYFQVPDMGLELSFTEKELEAMYKEEKREEL